MEKTKAHGAAAPGISGEVRPPVTILLLTVIALTSFPLISNDLWWHLATGRLIAETGEIPRIDPFSFGSQDIPWINHAWSFDVLLMVLSRLTGIHGLGFLRMALVAALAFVLFQFRRNSEPAWSSVALISFLLAVMRHRMMVRPELMALILYALLLALWLKQHRYRIPFSGLVLLVWVNTHASFVLGVLTVILFLVVDLLRGRDWIRAFKGSALLLVPLANPFGIEAYLAPIRLIRDLRSLPVTNPEWAAPSLPHFAPLLVAVVATLAAFAVGSWTRPREETIPRGLLLVALAVMAATSIRHAGFFAVAAALLVPPVGRRPLAPILGLLAAATFSWQVQWVQGLGWGIDRTRFPLSSLEIIEDIQIRGRLYNEAGMGGYLIWSLFPRHQVFMDGRNELFLELLPRVNAARGDLTSWNHLLQKFDIGFAVLPFEGEVMVIQGQRVRPMPASWSRFPPHSWALVAWDEAAMVFVARREGREIPGEFRFNPESEDYIVEQILSQQWSRDDVVREVGRALARDPDNRRAQRLLTLLHELSAYPRDSQAPKEWYQ